MRVVLIAECRRLAAQVSLALAHVNTAVDTIADAADAREAIEVHDYDLLIADLDHAPHLLLEFMKSKAPRHAVLRKMVCGCRDAMGAVKAAIDLGADDFLMKPFDAAELQLRVGCLSPLISKKSDPEQRLVYSFGPVSIDQSTNSVWLDQRLVNLTPREHGVLSALIRRPGQAVSKEQIAAKISSLDSHADPTAIETYVYRLRRKLEHPRITIRTIRGLGYLLDLKRE